MKRPSDVKAFWCEGLRFMCESIGGASGANSFWCKGLLGVEGLWCKELLV